VLNRKFQSDHALLIGGSTLTNTPNAHWAAVMETQRMSGFEELLEHNFGKENAREVADAGRNLYEAAEDFGQIASKTIRKHMTQELQELYEQTLPYIRIMQDASGLGECIITDPQQIATGDGRTSSNGLNDCIVTDPQDIPLSNDATESHSTSEKEPQVNPAKFPEKSAEPPEQVERTPEPIEPAPEHVEPAVQTRFEAADFDKLDPRLAVFLREVNAKSVEFQGDTVIVELENGCSKPIGDHTLNLDKEIRFKMSRGNNGEVVLEDVQGVSADVSIGFTSMNAVLRSAVVRPDGNGGTAVDVTVDTALGSRTETTSIPADYEPLIAAVVKAQEAAAA
jgi:hypothetical protein